MEGRPETGKLRMGRTGWVTVNCCRVVPRSQKLAAAEAVESMEMPSDASGKLWTRVLKTDQHPSE